MDYFWIIKMLHAILKSVEVLKLLRRKELLFLTTLCVAELTEPKCLYMMCKVSLLQYCDDPGAEQGARPRHASFCLIFLVCMRCNKTKLIQHDLFRGEASGGSPRQPTPREMYFHYFPSNHVVFVYFRSEGFVY